MKRAFALLIVLLIAASGCKKLTSPNEESKKILGKWDYVSNSGGFSGAGGSNRFCTECWVDITENGYFIVYEGKHKKSKIRFSIEMKESIYSGDLRPALVYKNEGYESCQYSGDTLYLSDEAYDGYTYRFVRR